MKTSKLDHMSQGKRREIAEMYKNKDVPVRQILETYGIGYKVLYACTEEFGVPYRDEKKRGRRSGYKLNQCPECKKGVSIMEARFCPFCGASMATEEDLLTDDLGTLWTLIGTRLSDNDAKIALQLINKIEKYLKEKNPRLTRFNQ